MTSSFHLLRRPHFFSGRLLTADDLQREQDYHLQRAHRLNRFVHGWGVVAGLHVKVDAAGDTVHVEPGIAIDCAGRELVLAEPAALPLSGLCSRHYVLLALHERPVDPVPTEAGSVHSAIEEGAQVQWAGENPAALHRRLGPGTPGCGHAHALCLAALTPRASGWQVRLMGRVRSRRGIRMPAAHHNPPGSHHP